MSFYRSFFIWLLVASCLAVTVGTLPKYAARPANSEHPDIPFGLEWNPLEKGVSLRDFPLMMQFVSHVWNHEIDRPYSLAGQEEVFHRWSPALHSGMPIAYAPPVILWYAPFLPFSPPVAFTLFCLCNTVFVYLLWRRFLLPRMQILSQIQLLLLAFFSISFLSTFRIGQNPIATTCLIALGWSLIYDWRSATKRVLNWKSECLLALILFVLSAKPNVALMFGCVCLAAGIWRPVVVSVALFAAACAALASHFGGWPTWLNDYLALLDNYHLTGLGNFLYYGPDASTNFVSYAMQVLAMSSGTAAAISRYVWLGGIATLLLLVWTRKISLLNFYLLNFAHFLLFCPSLSGTEDWTICLLIADAPFFKNQRHYWLKIILVIGVVDFYQAHRTPWEFIPIPFPCKLTLLVMAVMEAFCSDQKCFGETGSKKARHLEPAR